MRNRGTFGRGGKPRTWICKRSRGTVGDRANAAVELTACVHGVGVFWTICDKTSPPHTLRVTSNALLEGTRLEQRKKPKKANRNTHLTTTPLGGNISQISQSACSISSVTGNLTGVLRSIVMFIARIINSKSKDASAVEDTLSILCKNRTPPMLLTIDLGGEKERAKNSTYRHIIFTVGSISRKPK